MTTYEKENVAPHADDELISCGGTILNLIEEGWEVLDTLH